MVPKHIAPRALLRVMVDFGRSALGIIVTVGGMVVRLTHGGFRFTLELGVQARPELTAGA